jgi:hypothetical protein
MIWQSKHHMKIRNRQEFLFSFLDPFRYFMPLTGGAMSVSATMKEQVGFMALGTLINMSTKRHGSTFSNGMKRARLPRI